MTCHGMAPSDSERYLPCFAVDKKVIGTRWCGIFQSVWIAGDKKTKLPDLKAAKFQVSFFPGSSGTF